MTAWIDHVRSKAKEYGLSYKAAMSDARVKSSYTKAPRPKATKPQAPSEPPKTAKERRTMAASRAMELIHKRNADGSQSWHDAVSKSIQESADAGSRFMKEKKPRKPMSEETKAMLKARRATKKADVAKKFESFWERHGMGTTATTTQAVVDAIAGPSKQPQKRGKDKIVVYLSDGRGLTQKEASEMGFANGLVPRISPYTGKPSKPYRGNKVYILEDWYPRTSYVMAASLYKKGVTREQYAKAQAEGTLRELLLSKGFRV